MPLSYALVTPAHDEEDHLPRLAQSVVAQTLQPEVWLIVDDGSVDGTLELIRTLEERHAWIRSLGIPPGVGIARGGPVARSFSAGLAALDREVDVVVKVDADVSFAPNYFERLVARFAADPRLGISSGSAHERNLGGTWKQRFSTGTSVWGANRAYRWSCLPDVLPLEERMGWDTVDEHKAQLHGWNTETFLDLPFFHHRVEGGRDASRYAAWRAEGEVSYYLGYRPSYLLARTAYRSLREPAALGMLAGYSAALLRWEPRCADPGVRTRVREQQRVRTLGRRAREALGRAA